MGGLKKIKEGFQTTGLVIYLGIMFLFYLLLVPVKEFFSRSFNKIVRIWMIFQNRSVLEEDDLDD